MNDIDLQRWLASQLPELIALNFDQTQFFWRTQEHARHWPEITPREWLCVVWLVEAKLPNRQWDNYADSLIYKHSYSRNDISAFQLRATLSWQELASVLMEVLK